MSKETVKVHAFWDDEAQVWSARSDDVPGLATEAPSMDELVSKLSAMVPELLELNGPQLLDDHRQVPISLFSELNFRAGQTA